MQKHVHRSGEPIEEVPNPYRRGQGKLPYDRASSLRPKGKIGVSQRGGKDDPGRMYKELVEHNILVQDRGNSSVVREGFEYCTREFGNY